MIGSVMAVVIMVPRMCAPGYTGDDCAIVCAHTIAALEEAASMAPVCVLHVG